MRRRALAATLAACLAAPLLFAELEAHAADATIDRVMADLARAGPRRATFVEEKQIAALSRPLTSRGRLTFEPPAHLEKATDEPVVESITVDGDMLVYAKPAEDVSRRVSLDRAPEIRALVEAVRGTLAGDLTALRRFYSVGLDGSEDAWTLTLVPLDSKVRDLVKAVVIDGSSSTVRRVVTTEANGDTSSMTITPSG